MVHRMNVMSPAKGHAVLEWDPVDELSTETVKKEFDAMVGKGYMPFTRGKYMDHFDPLAEEITLSPVITAG